MVEAYFDTHRHPLMSKSQLSVMTTVHLYAFLTAMMHSLNFILNASVLNIILFLDKTFKTVTQHLQAVLPCFSCNSPLYPRHILDIPNGRRNSWHDRLLHYIYVICMQNIFSQELYGLVHCHAEIPSPAPLGDV